MHHDEAVLDVIVFLGGGDWMHRAVEKKKAVLLEARVQAPVAASICSEASLNKAQNPC